MKNENIVYKKKKHKKEKSSQLKSISMAVIAIIACMVSLCGASWAWFTASVGIGTASIHSATFRIENVTLTQNNSSVAVLNPDENGNYTTEKLGTGVYTITFQAANNTSAKGYCCITVFKNGETAGTPYYTSEIGETPYTVNIKTADEITVKIEPIWGNVDARVSADTARVTSGGEIPIGDLTKMQSAAPDNSANAPKASVSAQTKNAPSKAVSPSADSSKPNNSEEKTAAVSSAESAKNNESAESSAKAETSQTPSDTIQ